MPPIAKKRKCLNENCSNEVYLKESVFRGFCSTNCHYITRESNKALTSKKISEGRKKFLKNNPEKHPWRKKDKFVSAPCERIKILLKENDISFVEEHIIDGDRNYSLDIAFPNKKFAIEINGNQHHNYDGSLKAYYQDRHDYFISNGWEVLELHYLEAYKLEVEDILNIENFIVDDYSNIIATRLNKNKFKCTWGKAGNKVTFLWYLEQKDKIQLIENSNIDFSKYGWSGKVSKLIDIKPQKVRGWMTKCCPKILENAFKRNN